MDLILQANTGIITPELHMIKLGLSSSVTTPNFGRVGTTGNCYYNPGTRVSTYDPNTYTGVSGSRVEPWLKLPKNTYAVHVKIPSSYKFAFRGYNADVSVYYRDIVEFSDNVQDITIPITSEIAYMNLLFGKQNQTQSISDSDMAYLLANTLVEIYFTWEDIDIGFDSNKFIYNINVSSSYTRIRIRPTAINDNTSIKINGEVYIPETEESPNYYEVNLQDEGTTVVVISTESQDESQIGYYQLNLIRAAIGVNKITIDGLEHKIDFIPITSNYYYKHIINSENELPEISVSTNSFDYSTYIYINNEEISQASLVEGENIIEIKAGSSYEELNVSYVITIDIIIDDAFIDNFKSESGKIYPIYKIDKVYKYCTVEIDLTEPDSFACCSYIDDAKIFSPSVNNDLSLNKEAFDKWDRFFGHYPVLFKDGREIVRINPNDFTKDIFGNSVSDVDGDIMIKFPRRGININYKNANTLLVSMTDNPNDFRYTYYAHNIGNIKKDAFYLGAYKLGLDNIQNSEAYRDINNSKGRSASGYYIEKGEGESLSSTTTFVNIPSEIFRYYCENNNVANEGTGEYRIEHIFQRIYLQVMYILKYCNLNSQATIGAGLVSTSPGLDIGRNTSYNKTGYTDTYGMDSENVREIIPHYREISDDQVDNPNTYHVKLFGIEDIWGNANELIFGLYLDKSQSSKILQSLYYNQDYTLIDNINNYLSYDYLKKPMGYSELGFIGKETISDSSNNYFCDKVSLINPSTIVTDSGIVRITAFSNGDCVSEDSSGIFTSNINNIVINREKSNFNWFLEQPRFERDIFSSSLGSVSALETEPSNWSTYNYCFICSADTTSTARLMYL